MDNIKKRNGEIVKFDPNKIHNAMRKAFVACGWKEDDESLEGFLNILTKRVIDKTISSNSDSVEQIQDHVEMVLMEAGEYNVAKAYVEYRYTRALARKSNTTDESILSLLRNQNKELNEENSNKSTILASTQRDYMAGEVSRDLTRRILLPQHISKAHDEGILHFHDMDYFVQPIFNCFSSKTKFVTDRGVKAFNEFKDGETVAVLTKDGFYSQSTVRCYGKQPLYDITLCKNGMSRVVTATKNHRWILSDGSVTMDLKVGDALFPLMDITPYTAPKTKRDCEMFALGFAIGDGSDSAQKGINLRLCGEKNKYLNYFITAGWAVMPGGKNSNNDNFLYLSMDISKQDVLNGRIWRYLDLNDKIMLFSGYYAADGCKDRDMIFTADDRVAMMIEEISATAGYHIVSHSIKYKDTQYKENAMLHHFRFNRYHYRNWSVTSIVPHRRDLLPQDVWCVEEPVTHSFTLEGGIVTGNCCLVNIGDMLDNGTVMNGKMIETPKSFQVACTVMTQIIAAVASNQYGGQSVDMRHLGKYLRKSKQKLYKRFRETFPNMDSYNIDKLVEVELKEELKAGVQTIQYQVNSLMTTNGQSPFVTLFLYLDKDDPYIEENALIIEEILNQRLQGIKNECGVYTTPAFPKLVYVLDEWNNLTDGKYDYITKLACKCTAKRMYPDYISAKKMRENYEGNVFSPMGCRSFLAPWKDTNGKYKFEGRLTA